MTELVKSKYPPRVRFPKGKQGKFLEFIQRKLNTNAEGLAGLAGLHPRTIRDWRREKLLLSLPAFRKFCKKAHIIEPRSVKIVDPFWYTKLGGHLGGIAVYKKYGIIGGNPANRKEKWYEWWERKGKYQKRPIFLNLPFRQPKRSRALAEFVGIMMGDGGMSTNQICITLHHKDDLKYSKFVVNLAEKLFGVTPSIYHRPKISINNIVISRSGLVKHLNSLGLPIGNKVKQRFDIPEWIKQDHTYQLSCLRGLVDTDGCVFLHRYQVRNKWYLYKKLSFTTASLPLRNSVFWILKRLGFNPRISQQRDVRLDSKKDVARYFSLVGSHNPKHLNKYQN